jgi:PIN domain
MDLEALKAKVRLGEIKAIAFDTTVFDSSGQRFKSGILQQLGQFKDTQTSLLISEITREEIISHLTDKIDKIRKTLSGVLRDVKDYSIFGNLEIVPLVQNIDPRETALNQFNEFMVDTSLEVIPAQGNVLLDEVIYRYFNAKPPFSKGKKKNEFPDAIALISLESWAKRFQSTVIVVSQDNDWKDFCESSKDLIFSDDLAKVISLFQLEDADSICVYLSTLYKQGDTTEILDYIYDALTDYICDLEEIKPDIISPLPCLYEYEILETLVNNLQLSAIKSPDVFFIPISLDQYSGQISGSQSPVLEEAEVVRMGFNQSWVKV